MTDSRGRKTFLLRISKDLHAEIKAAADKNRVSMSSYCLTAIMHWMDLDAKTPRRGEPSDPKETRKCPDCGSNRFIVDSDLNCFDCGRTLVKSGEFSENYSRRGGIIKASYEIKEKKPREERERWWE